MLIIAIVLISVVVIAVITLTVIIGAKCEEMRAFSRVDAIFRRQWDGSKTNELHTWMKLRARMAGMNIPTIYIEAADKHIAIVKSRHITYRTVRLRNGKPVVISTQN